MDKAEPQTTMMKYAAVLAVATLALFAGVNAAEDRFGVIHKKNHTDIMDKVGGAFSDLLDKKKNYTLIGGDSTSILFFMGLEARRPTLPCFNKKRAVDVGERTLSNLGPSVEP